MLEQAGAKNRGLKKSLDGLKELVDKMKLEGTSKQMEIGKAVERLIKLVDGMHERSDKMEKVAVLKNHLDLYSFQGIKGALEKLVERIVEKVGSQNKEMVEQIGSQNTGLKQMVKKFGTQNAGIKESVEGLKRVVQKMKLNSTIIEKVI